MTTRTDLPFIRRRARSAPAAAAARQQPTGRAGVAGFLRSRSRRPARMPQRTAPLPAAAPGADLLDPDTPPVASMPAGGNPLDLGTSGPPEASDATRRAPTGTGSLLDLGGPPAAPPAAAGTSPSGRHHRLIRHDLALRSIAAGERRRMDPDDPVVHLTRAQSAFGALEVQPAIARGAHLTLGAAYEIDGREGVILPGLSPMGPDPRKPVLRATSTGVVVNLRRIGAIDRILFYAVLPQQDRRMPGGTVVVTTYGGARLELPLTSAPTYGAQALLTAYVVEGRMVLRAEHDPFSGTLHQVCDAYGFSELTWRDPFTPLV